MEKEQLKSFLNKDDELQKHQKKEKRNEGSNSNFVSMTVKTSNLYLFIPLKWSKCYVKEYYFVCHFQFNVNV